MEQGFSWGTAADIVTVIGGFVAFFTAWYRYKSSTPLEKLFMEGADRVLIQVGTIVNYVGIVILWMAIMNACGLWISPLSNMLIKMLKADSSDIYSSIFVTLVLLCLLIWTQTFISKSDSSNFYMDENTMRLDKKSETAGFNNPIKTGIIMGEIEAIIILIYIICSRVINRDAIVFFPIKITLDLVFDVFCRVFRRIRYRWIWKLIGKYTFAGSSTIGILVCVSDFVYLCCLYYVGKMLDNFWGSLATIIFCFIAFAFLRVKANELKDSNSEPLSKFKSRYIAISLVVFGIVLVPYFLEYNGLDMFNIMACIMGDDKSSLSVNMNIIMILLGEMAVMLLSLGGWKAIKTWINFQEVTLRLVNLSTGNSWFAYRVCDGQLLYGDDREYKNQSSSQFISMTDIYNGKYALTDANVEPQELRSYEIMKKMRDEGNIDRVIDVSTKKARRSKGYNFIEDSSFDDSLGESGAVNISLIEDRLPYKQIDKNSRILVYCEEENRLQVAAWRLIAMGYKSVYIYKAGKDC